MEPTDRHSGKTFVNLPKPEQKKKAENRMAKAATKPVPLVKPVVVKLPAKRRVDVASLTPISEAMGADKSPKEILQLILKAAFSITRASSASLMLIDEGTETLKVEVAEGFKGKRIFNTR